MPPQPPSVEAVGSQLPRGEVLNAIGASGELDLETQNAQLPKPLDVAGVTRLSVHGVLKSGVWLVAVVSVLGGLDGTNFPDTITTLTGAALVPNLDVSAYQFVQFKVTTIELQAGIVRLATYGYNPLS